MAASKITTGASFPSWENFQEALKDFKAVHPAEFSVVCSKSVEAANKKLSTSVAPHPQKHKFAYVQFGCIHFGKPRARSTGLRPHQS